MILERIDHQFPGLVQDRHSFRGDATAVIPADRLLEAADFLFSEGFQMLVDLTAVDWPEREPRFDVVYHWLNLASQERLRLKVPLADGGVLPSLVSRFATADWYEREVWDMFGLRFEGHPDLRRLLMWEDHPGHPLRKDYPLDGGDAFCNQDTGTSYAGHAHTLQD